MGDELYMFCPSYMPSLIQRNNGKTRVMYVSVCRHLLVAWWGCEQIPVKDSRSKKQERPIAGEHANRVPQRGLGGVYDSTRRDS